MSDCDYDPFAVCGEQHPRYPEMTCIRKGGKCLTDWHIGIASVDGVSRYVAWGKSYDESLNRSTLDRMSFSPLWLPADKNAVRDRLADVLREGSAE